MSALFKKGMALLCALLMIASIAACTDDGGGGTDKPVISGVTDNAVYILGEDTIIPSFDKGSATLKKDAESAAAFTSGTEITETGTYVLTVTYGETFSKATFIVRNPDAPVVTGVSEGAEYTQGAGGVKPVFNKGAATISLNGGAEAAFNSGDELTALGQYVLKVTYKSVSTTVTFKIIESYPVYDNQITDEFNNQYLSSQYIRDEGLDAFIEAGAAVLINSSRANDPWSMMKRRFAAVNLTAYPYVEVKVDEIGAGPSTRLEISVDTNEFDDLGNRFKFSQIEYAGTYYLDVKAWAESKSLDVNSQDIYLIMGVVGNTKGYACAKINYVRSVAAIPQAAAAGQYVDNTAESLSAWREDKAAITAESLPATAFVTYTDTYGAAVKRVALNTVAYPYLVADIADVQGGAQWGLKYKTDSGSETVLVGDNKGMGKATVNLGGIPAIAGKESVYVTLFFYVIGNGLSDKVLINGFYTAAEAPDPLIVDDFSSANWTQRAGEVSIAGGEMTIALGDGSEGKAEKFFNLNTADNSIIRLGVAGTSGEFAFDGAFEVEVINENTDPWAAFKVKGNSADGSITIIEREGGGCDVYIDLSKSSDAEKLVGEFTLKIVIFIEGDGGSGKYITLDGISLTDEIPEV